jgi:hypothetical protein
MTFIPPQQRADLIWCAVDFDGTLAQSTWSPENPTAVPGEPIWENIVKLNKMVFVTGLKVVVHTSRSWADYEIIEAWLDHYNVPFSRIICGKLLAKVYIDDRGISAFDDSWIPKENVPA